MTFRYWWVLDIGGSSELISGDEPLSMPLSEIILTVLITVLSAWRQEFQFRARSTSSTTRNTVSLF